jgi:hypothetical protein
MATKIDPGTPGWQQRHVELYLKTDGAEGHVLDFGRPGVPEVNCLLLETTGRKSHTTKITPLIYGKDGAASWCWPQGAGRRIILPGSSTSGMRLRFGFRWWTKNTAVWRESRPAPNENACSA